MADEEKKVKKNRLTRRDFIKYTSASAGIAAASLALTGSVSSGSHASNFLRTDQYLHGHPENVSAPRQVEGGITPMEFLEDYYKPPLVAGKRVFELTAASQTVAVANGVQFPSWVFTAPSRPPPFNMPTVPGPTLRVEEGDTVLIKFHNGDRHPHTIHLHGIHRGDADGVFEIINTGKDYEYEFTADPFGLFLYHCHVMPVKKHIEKGLYGAFIVDPVTDPLTGQPVTRPPYPDPVTGNPVPAREMVMVMNGFDVDFDGENDFYTVNGIANYYLDNPISIRVGELVRIYLVNMTEFDPVNSFHLHGNMFRLYRTGTRFDPTAVLDPPADPLLPLDDLDTRVRKWLHKDRFAEVADTVFLGQGERAILEFIPKTVHALRGRTNPTQNPRFLFHAHQSEFVELGWTGLFEVI